jgi:hypothetical protein
LPQTAGCTFPAAESSLKPAEPELTRPKNLGRH